MLAAVEETAGWTTGRIRAIRDLLDATTERCRRELPARVYSRELIELIFVQPYVRIGFLVEAGNRGAQNRLDVPAAVGAHRVLAGEKHGREMIYRNPALLEVLSA